MTGAWIVPEPLTAATFTPFGDVIEVDGHADWLINAGKCGRFHDRARLEFLEGHAGISLFDAEARHLPYTLDLMERHPLGSQAFVPLDGVPMLLCVAEDARGRPAMPRAFLSQPGQVVNILRNVWHGVLAPIGRSGRYAVIDRIGPGDNLEEFCFDQPLTVEGSHS